MDVTISSFWIFAEKLAGKAHEGLQPQVKGAVGTAIEKPSFTPSVKVVCPNVLGNRQPMYQYVSTPYQPEEKKEIELIASMLFDYWNEVNVHCPHPLKIGFHYDRQEKLLTAWLLTDLRSKAKLCYYDIGQEIASKYLNKGIYIDTVLCETRFCDQVPDGFLEFSPETIPNGISR